MQTMEVEHPLMPRPMLRATTVCSTEPGGNARTLLLLSSGMPRRAFCVSLHGLHGEMGADYAKKRRGRGVSQFSGQGYIGLATVTTVSETSMAACSAERKLWAEACRRPLTKFQRNKV